MKTQVPLAIPKLEIVSKKNELKCISRKVINLINNTKLSK